MRLFCLVLMLHHWFTLHSFWLNPFSHDRPFTWKSKDMDEKLTLWTMSHSEWHITVGRERERERENRTHIRQCCPMGGNKNISVLGKNSCMNSVVCPWLHFGHKGSCRKLHEVENIGTVEVCSVSHCLPPVLSRSLYLSWVLSKMGAPGSRLQHQSFAPSMLLEPVAVNACFACLPSLSYPLLSSTTLLCCSGCSSRWCTLANSSQWRRPERLAVISPPLLSFLALVL